MPRKIATTRVAPISSSTSDAPPPPIQVPLSRTFRLLHYLLLLTFLCAVVAWAEAWLESNVDMKNERVLTTIMFGALPVVMIIATTWSRRALQSAVPPTSAGGSSDSGGVEKKHEKRELEVETLDTREGLADVGGAGSAISRFPCSNMEETSSIRECHAIL